MEQTAAVPRCNVQHWTGVWLPAQARICNPLQGFKTFLRLTHGCMKLLGRETKDHIHRGLRIRIGGAVSPLSATTSLIEQGTLWSGRCYLYTGVVFWVAASSVVYWIKWNTVCTVHSNVKWNTMCTVHSNVKWNTMCTMHSNVKWNTMCTVHSNVKNVYVFLQLLVCIICITGSCQIMGKLKTEI